MEQWTNRLRRYLDAGDAEAFGLMVVWAQNELLPQISAARESKHEVLLFLGIHAFVQTFMTSAYALERVDATRTFLERFMDGADEHAQFSVVADEVHEMRNVMAHQLYSTRSHNIGFDYTMEIGWRRDGDALFINPNIYGHQFMEAVDGGRLWGWKSWTTEDQLARQKWRFIVRWLDLSKSDPLRVAVKHLVELPTLAEMRRAEAGIREQFRSRYGV